MKEEQRCQSSTSVLPFSCDGNAQLSPTVKDIFEGEDGLGLGFYLLKLMA